MELENLSAVEKQKFSEIVQDPVLFSRVFIKTFDPVSKKMVPWSARWYQVEMLRDKSVKKVARCGRRTGKVLPIACELLGSPRMFSYNVIGNDERECLKMNRHS